MKRNDYCILIAGMAYSYLFYQQDAGINFLLFSILLVALAAFQNPTVLKQPKWLAVALGTILSGMAVFYLGTMFPVYINLLSLLLLASYSFNAQSSLFISVLHAVYSMMVFVPAAIINLVNSNITNEQTLNTRGKKIILTLMPVVVTGVFFELYRSSNPLFQSVTNKINFDFISMEWVAFTLLAFILMGGFFKQRIIAAIDAVDKNSPDKLAYVSEEEHAAGPIASVLSRHNEVYTGVVLLGLLNLLLFFANGIDVYYLYVLERLPEGMTLSKYLHDGTNGLIISIVLAISVILFYFRGRLNFSEDNTTIRVLAYAWIAQNIFLVATTVQRNLLYVSIYSLTHKRIGVYFFLGLCIAGLLITLIKIVKVKSNWFLFRQNTWLWYMVLLFSCVVNWDGVIVHHNLKFAEQNDGRFDDYYLGNLDYASLPALLEHYNAEKMDPATQKVFTHYLTLQMKNRYQSMVSHTEGMPWQSTCYIHLRTKNEVKQLLKNDKFFFP